MAKPSVEGDYIVSHRSGIVENTHQIHAAVVDSTGKILYHLGNPHRMTLARSAVKPAQAIAVVETGALEKYGFDEADLSLLCASHNGEDRHVDRVRLMMTKSGTSEADLRCGGHSSISPTQTNVWARAGFVPTAVYSSCSGKHTGMMAGARALGEGVENYHREDHPMQARVKAVMEDLTGLDSDDVRWAIDGCNMPSPAFPLLRLAKINALFAPAADKASCSSEQHSALTAREETMARIFYAMCRNPDNVAGQERLCTALMKAYGDLLIGKSGADGSYAVGIRKSEFTQRLGIDGAVGVAIKVEDGNVDASYGAMIEILEQLGIGSPETRQKLESFHRSEITNTMGVVTGQLSFPFRLRSE